MESYRIGKKQKSHLIRSIALAIVVLLLLAGAGVWAKFYFRANTVIDPPPAPVTSQVTNSQGPTKGFDEGNFTIKLPQDWEYIGRKTQTAPYAPYAWHNTKNNPGVEELEIYVDTIPTTLGVNRVLPVQGNGSHVVPTTVSDSCADFTGNNKLPGAQNTPAKWGGIDFLCDLANYERDVVGTSSSDGANVVKVTGATSGSHQIFFMYTDNGSTPNFQIFENAVSSFTLK